MSFEDMGVLGDADDGQGSAAVADFLVELRSLARVAAPVPSPELAKLLAGGASVVSLASKRRRRAVRGAAILATASLVGTGWAAAANELPPAAQTFVANLSDRFLPLDLPRPAPVVDPPASSGADGGGQGRNGLDDGARGGAGPSEGNRSGDGSGRSTAGDDQGGSEDRTSERDDDSSGGGFEVGGADDASGSDDGSESGSGSGSGASEDAPDREVEDAPDREVEDAPDRKVQDAPDLEVDSGGSDE